MALKDKKILLTGGSGFLGTHVLEALREHGVPGKNIAAPDSKKVNLLLRADCEKAVKGVDVVIHLAGLTGGGKLHKERPAEIFYENIIAGVELMDAARRSGVKKFIAAGSAAEYPEHASLPLREEDLWSGFPEQSHAPYAVAKRALLVQGQAYRAQYGFDVVHLLFTSMYGPFAKRGSGVIPFFIDLISEAKRSQKKEIEVPGRSISSRDFLYVGDAAWAVVLAAEAYDKSEPINIGSGKEISVKDVAKAVAKIIDFNGALNFASEKSGVTSRRVLDTSRAEKELGFLAATSLESGLQKTIEWYNAQI